MRRLQTASLRTMNALLRGVFPLWSGALGSAPCERSWLTGDVRPNITARCKGVFPLLSAMVQSAPASSKMCVMATLDLAAAQ